MNSERKNKNYSIYILAVMYVIAVYASPFLCYAANSNIENEPEHYWPLFIPAVFGFINLITVILINKKTDRKAFLRCAVIIKCALIPYYIIGGLIIAAALLMMFTPVVIMIFVGPVVAVMFSVIGWISMIGAASFSVGYIVASYKNGVIGRTIAVITGILQFIFVADVVSVIVLAIREKSKK